MCSSDLRRTRALVLELVEGPTLADRIEQGPIPLDKALPVPVTIVYPVSGMENHRSRLTPLPFGVGSRWDFDGTVRRQGGCR